MELDKPFKKDKNGLWYLDSRDIKTKEIYFPEVGKCNARKNTFYLIEGMDNYIIKDSTEYPYFMNRFRNLSLLKKLVEKQSDIPEIDFPFAYCKDYGILRGIVEVFYQEAISLNDLLFSTKYNDSSLSQLELIKKYYDHDSNNIDNVIMLLLKILELISKMYYHSIFYTDIKAGNFLLFNNDVKVIDFEPGLVHFKDRNDWYLNFILINFAILVETVLKRCGFKDVFFSPGEDFYETEKRILSLRKTLER